MSTRFLDADGTVRLAGVPNVLSATVTTDPNDFYGGHLFDLGHPAFPYVTMTVLGLTPDGETFGSGAGDIQVDPVADVATTPNPQGGISPDGVTFFAGVPVGIVTPPADTVGGLVSFGLWTPRYLGVSVFIYDVDSGLIYAGANNPSAQVRLDVTYV